MPFCTPWRYLFILYFWGLTELIFAQSPEDKGLDKNTPRLVPTPAQKKDSLMQSAGGIEKPQNDSQKNNPQDSLKKRANETQEGIGFEFLRQLSIVSEDTTQNLIGENKVVQVSEEVRIDSFWVKVSEHYAVINTADINAMHSKKSVLTDSVRVRLYNPPTGNIWAHPLERILQTSNFGYRWGGFHAGIDLDLKLGTPVFAVFDGIVEFCNWYHGYGMHVVIKHYNGISTSYSHLSSIKVEEGQRVKAGQLIGLGGSTGFSFGAHLHFETHFQGYPFNPNLIFDYTRSPIPDVPLYFTFTPKHFPFVRTQRIVIYHTVLLGETLETIAKKYSLDVETLCKQNNITPNTPLQVGQRLIIKS
ncbi:MAG: M23 family metallopeptidase [Microscillaceae bacterium]|nr:M23 family metallopeptidase [Microscillaceae bacterium]MDW8461118.1 M23 family metallopeptidase [Cytophagales bacterium]